MNSPPLKIHKWLRLAVLILYPVLLIGYQAGKSHTMDEPVHIAAGYSYLQFHEILLNFQHPPFIKELSAIPLLFIDLKFPATRQALVEHVHDPHYPRELSGPFLYGNNFRQILFLARLPIIGLALGMAVVVMFWADQLWGKKAGTFALLLLVLEPNLTAHAQLVTTDVGAAFFSTLFLFCLWQFTQKPGTARLAACGIALGMALGTKFSMVILIPLSAVLLSIHAWRSAQGERSIHEGSTLEQGKTALSLFSKARICVLLRAGSHLLAVYLIAGLVLWIIFLFPSDPFFYWKGLSRIYEDKSTGYAFFLLGSFDLRGWWYYLAVAWLVKSPLPYLLLFACLPLCLKDDYRSSWLKYAWLLLPWLSFFVSYSLMSVNIGVRYLLPCFPLLILAISRIAASDLVRNRAGKLALIVLTGWITLDYLRIAPDHLSYFNQIAGGYRGGINWLDDSNVDWGQGLFQLKTYMDKSPKDFCAICVAGNTHLTEHGINIPPVSNLGYYQTPPCERIVLSSHCLARLKAAMTQRWGNVPGNWPLHQEPAAIVGHAFYIYEFPITSQPHESNRPNETK